MHHSRKLWSIGKASCSSRTAGNRIGETALAGWLGREDSNLPYVLGIPQADSERSPRPCPPPAEVGIAILTSGSTNDDVLASIADRQRARAYHSTDRARPRRRGDRVRKCVVALAMHWLAAWSPLGVIRVISWVRQPLPVYTNTRSIAALRRTDVPGQSPTFRAGFCGSALTMSTRPAMHWLLLDRAYRTLR
jgi:hypothetical protein